MKLNRREFVRLGTLGSAGFLTACGSSNSTTPGNSSTPLAANTPITDLTLEVKGLIIAQWAKPALRLHLIDGAAVGMPAHFARLKVPKDMIDPSSTVAHTPDPEDLDGRLIDLTNKSITLPGTGTAPPSIEVNESPIGTGVPSTPEGWRSVRHSAYLPTISGATQITDTTKFYANVLVNHASVTCGPPEGTTGLTTVWTFRDPSTGQPIAPPQAMSDVLVCRTKIVPGQASLMIGNQTLVLKPGQAGTIVITNEPAPPPPGQNPPACPNNKKVCAEHLSVYYALVNATVKPVVEGTVVTPGVKPANTTLIDPNYCPPAFIASAV